MRLRTLHQLSGTVVAAFIVLHLANHLTAVFIGIPAHLAFMEVARKLYRQPVVEMALLGCVAAQVASAASRWP